MKNSKRRLRKSHKRKMRRNPGLCSVYGLYDSNGKLRYIGQTRMQLSDRLKYYFRNAKNNRSRSPVEKWVLNSMIVGDKVEIKAIDENATWDVSEIIYIDRAKRDGIELLNILRGGRDNMRDFLRK